MRDTERGEPVGEQEQILGHGGKGALQSLGSTVLARNDTTDHDSLLVDVESGTVGVKNVHALPR